MATLNPELDDFDVTFWQVVENRSEQPGRRVLGVPLSPKYSTLESSREALVDIKGKHPHAYVSRVTIFFHEGDPADIAERKGLLEEMHCVSA
jgi:hypothetical protein